jgi:CheY-like chemotaxis protein
MMIQVRMFLAVALGWVGNHVLTTESGKLALRLLEYQEVVLILVDLLMPDTDGLELIPRLRKTRPASKIIAISGGTGQCDYLDASRYLGAHATLKKAVQSARVIRCGHASIEVLTPIRLRGLERC